MSEKSKIVIIGGGPGGYEAALVAAQLGADVTVVDQDGLGGAAVLTDVVPSKTLIATAEVLATVHGSSELGIKGLGRVRADLGAVNRRVQALAKAQSEDIRTRLEGEGVRIVIGRGVLDGPGRVRVRVEGVGDGPAAVGSGTAVEADTILISTGARPRELPDALPDGERILNWTQLYELEELPERLIVVGSGVTGVEFVHIFESLGSDVTLVVSRQQILPHRDPEVAAVLEDNFLERGVKLLIGARATAIERVDDGVLVTCDDGRKVTGSHALLAIGAVPITSDLGLDELGIVTDGGFLSVDQYQRTKLPHIYGAGDCTGQMLLSSVGAMQGRKIARHAMGLPVVPIDYSKVSQAVFTEPEIASVGATEDQGGD